MEIGSEEWSEFLIDRAKTFDIDIDSIQLCQFTAHAFELIKWTRKINLTAITEPTDIASKHILDSLIPAQFIAPPARLLDIGSGGGFPGIPLKVILPGLSVTLIDASRKKVSFLKHIIRTLRLDNIEAIHIRAEELAGHPEYVNRFDIIISRALSSLETFVRLALPLLAEEGLIVALKGRVDKREIEDLQRQVINPMDPTVSFGRQLSVALKKYSLPPFNSNRSIIAFRRVLTD